MGSSSIPHRGARAPVERVSRAYILQNQVTHSRLLPAASKHSFVYPTLSLLLPLDALERQQLDLLRGWFFGYGGVWGRVIGLRPSGYLHDIPRDKRSIKHKLKDVLDERGWPGSELRDAWLMTMPSFLGYEGINPLNVYFCYRHGNSSLWLVVLEIHNTFGERNVNILVTGKSEDSRRGSGWDHQWTFPRQFHVSPFNDRSGHYICQVTSPSHPPFHHDEVPLAPPPRPIVKITLLTAPPHGQPKLIAVLRTTRSTPLSSASLLSALARAPFVLLLSFPRILYQAILLHYHKRLDVYQRPEPRAPDPAVEAHLPTVSNAVQLVEDPIGGGIGWQSEGFFEAWCKNRIHTFLRRRCAETGISVTFISSNPFEGQTTIDPDPARKLEDRSALSIYYRSPRLFTIIFMMPSPEHALLFGSQAEKIFSVSSEELFVSTFAGPPSRSTKLPISSRLTQYIRKTLVPVQLKLPLPSHHTLDDPMGFMPVFVLSMLWFFANLERKVFSLLGARFVPGDEPWEGWTRLHTISLRSTEGDLGSKRREY